MIASGNILNSISGARGASGGSLAANLVSLAAVTAEYPHIVELLVAAQPAMTPALAADAPLSGFMADFQPLVTACTPDTPRIKNLDLERVKRVVKQIGLFNKCIARGSTIAEPFLTACGFPSRTINFKGAVTQARFFPHREHTHKPQAMLASAKTALEQFGDELPVGHRTIDFEALMKSGTTAEFPPDLFTYGSEHPLASSLLVRWHTDSRKKSCRTPVSLLAASLKRILRPDNAAIELRIVKGKPEIFIPCPECKAQHRTQCMVHLPFSKFCNFIKQIDPARAATQVAAPSEEDTSLEVDSSHELWSIVELYNKLRQFASFRNPLMRRFTCSNMGCKHAPGGEPYIFQVSDGCRACNAPAVGGAMKHYHTMFCPSCATEGCGLCSKPLSEHTPESQFCPVKPRASAEDRARLKASGVLVCINSACERPIDWNEGCPHLTCPDCATHFCGNCMEHLSIDPVARTRYVHKCKAAVKRADGYFVHTVEAAADTGRPIAHAEVNPCMNHGILNPEQSWMIWKARQAKPPRSVAGAAGGGGAGGALHAHAAHVGGGGALHAHAANGGAGGALLHALADMLAHARAEAAADAAIAEIAHAMGVNPEDLVVIDGHVVLLG